MGEIGRPNRFGSILNPSGEGLPEIIRVDFAMKGALMVFIM